MFFDEIIEMKQKISRGLGFDKSVPDASRVRLKLDGDALIYAVGDVHGCLDLLVSIEEIIARDAATMGTPAHVILLGDVVDRGSNSAQILDYLARESHDAISRICLAGNHEEMMLEFLAEPDPQDRWLKFGGRETLVSYGLVEATSLSRRELQNMIRALVPQDHQDFLAACPVLVETPTHIFTHAGVAVDLPLEEQSDHDLMWCSDGMRSDYSGFSKTVVHGHQVVREPSMASKRINLDVGSYATGRLAAARFFRDEPPLIFGTSAL